MGPILRDVSISARPEAPRRPEQNLKERPGDLRPAIPDFLFQLIQLADIPFESIRGTPSGVLILRTMKAERLAQLLCDAVWEEALLVAVPREVFELVLRYLVAADVDHDAFVTRIATIQNPSRRSNAMRLAQQLRQEGVLQSARQAVIEVLMDRFESVPDGLAEVIEAETETARIRELLRMASRCTSIEDFAAAI